MRYKVISKIFEGDEHSIKHRTSTEHALLMDARKVYENLITNLKEGGLHYEAELFDSMDGKILEIESSLPNQTKEIYVVKKRRLEDLVEEVNKIETSGEGKLLGGISSYPSTENNKNFMGNPPFFFATIRQL